MWRKNPQFVDERVAVPGIHSPICQPRGWGRVALHRGAGNSGHHLGGSVSAPLVCAPAGSKGQGQRVEAGGGLSPDLRFL